MTAVAGLVLAAGAGRRFGGPKAPFVWQGERLVDRAVRVLRDGGCAEVTVVLGAWVGEVPGAGTVINDGWAAGLGSSLVTGLNALTEGPYQRVAVTLVDLPGLSAVAVQRVLATGGDLVVATYDEVRGHPVVLGRQHWAGAAAAASGETGARGYLRSLGDHVALVEVGDVADGADLDRRPSARVRP